MLKFNFIRIRIALTAENLYVRLTRIQITPEFIVRDETIDFFVRVPYETVPSSHISSSVLHTAAVSYAKQKASESDTSDGVRIICQYFKPAIESMSLDIDGNIECDLAAVACMRQFFFNV